MISRSALAALLALVSAPAAAATTEAHITYAAVDAWDPVVLLDIGTRQVQVSRGDETAYDGSKLYADLSGSGAGLTTTAQAAVGALHVFASARFTGFGQAGDLRSANFNAYAGWTDTLMAQFKPFGAQDGYAFIDLLVAGSAQTTAGPQSSGGLPFARTYAGISVTGTNATDSIRTTIAALDNVNYVTRHLVDDPDYVGDADHFDPYRGQYFTEDAPATTGARLIFEGGSDYFPDPTLVSGTAFATLGRRFTVRVPFTAGVDTDLDVRIKCETYGGAEPGDAAGGACDLLHSVYWGGIDHVTDRDGNALSGVTFGSASGFDYARSYFDQPDSGVVPEPASWAMVIAGFGLIGAAARRRRALA